MKRRKTISMLLVLILRITALPVQIFGKNIVRVGTPTLSDTLGTQEEIEAARETYLALTPEIKAIFDASLVDDPKMLEFHLSYVDKSFKPPAANWDQVAPKWDSIVRAFQKAFSKTASNVSAAFLKIKSDAKKVERTWKERI